MDRKTCVINREKYNAYHIDWYHKNKEKISEQRKAWRLANPDKIKAQKERSMTKRRDKNAEYAKQYRLENKDKVSAYNKEYRQNNKSRIYARNRSRKQKMLIQQMPSWADKSAMEIIYQQARRRSQIEGIKYHVDHIIPLNGNIVSGLHIESNLQILTARDNVTKKNNFVEIPCTT